VSVTEEELRREVEALRAERDVLDAWVARCLEHAVAQAKHRPYGPDALCLDVAVAEARREVWEDVVELLRGGGR
jgi:hypothetical protein